MWRRLPACGPVKEITLWRTEVSNRPGALAEVLGPLAEAGGYANAARAKRKGDAAEAGEFSTGSGGMVATEAATASLATEPDSAECPPAIPNRT